MTDADLLSIGRFARLSGLSIGALRHYHEVGILEPASIDPATGYRRYRRAQLDAARLVARLRDLDLPLPEIRAVLGSDASGRRRLLAAHRTRLMAGLAHAQRRIHWLNQALENQETLMTSTPAIQPDVGDRRQLAVDLFNHVWTLLEAADRTPMQDDEMLHAAHASRYHWGEVGEPVNLVRGEWQCSRVYATLGRAEPALWHARRCLALCEEHGIGDFDIAFAHEAVARALSVAGDRAGSDAALARARDAAAAIGDDEDRELLLSDLATIG